MVDLSLYTHPVDNNKKKSVIINSTSKSGLYLYFDQP